MTYFTLHELTYSATAAARGIPNTPPPEAVSALRALADNVLDPLRRAWGRPIVVNSGYRSAPLNKAVGGVPTSQHLKGQAADITAGSTQDNRALFDLCRRLALPFDQLILEKGGQWLHISHKTTGNRHQTLTT